MIYQLNQHLHDFFGDEILGVVQQDVSVIGLQGEATEKRNLGAFWGSGTFPFISERKMHLKFKEVQH